MDKTEQATIVAKAAMECESLQEGITMEALDALQAYILLENMRRHLIDVAMAMQAELPKH